MSNANSVNDKNFEDQVINHNGPVLVDFYTDTCPPCRHMAPILDELAEELSEKVKILKLNATDNMELAVKYAVKAVPTFILFKNGQVDKVTTGAMPKDEFKKWLETPS